MPNNFLEQLHGQYGEQREITSSTSDADQQHQIIRALIRSGILPDGSYGVMLHSEKFYGLNTSGKFAIPAMKTTQQIPEPPEPPEPGNSKGRPRSAGHKKKKR